MKIVGLSCDCVESHLSWLEDIKEWQGLQEVSFPIVGDPSREIAVAYGMVPPEERESGELPLTARSVFIVGTDRTLKLALLYPVSTGEAMMGVLLLLLVSLLLLPQSQCELFPYMQQSKEIFFQICRNSLKLSCCFSRTELFRGAPRDRLPAGLR